MKEIVYLDLRDSTFYYQHFSHRCKSVSLGIMYYEVKRLTSRYSM